MIGLRGLRFFQNSVYRACKTETFAAPVNCVNRPCGDSARQRAARRTRPRWLAGSPPAQSVRSDTVTGMTETSQPAGSTIPTYSRGTWTEQPFPIPGYADFQDWDKFMSDGGYSDFTTIKGGELSLNVWQWTGRCGRLPDGAAAFVIDLEGSGTSDTVAAVDVVDAMELLGKWAPIVQAALLGHLMSSAQYGPLHSLEFNPFAAIGALMAEGAEQRGDWAAKQRQRTLEARERAR